MILRAGQEAGCIAHPAVDLRIAGHVRDLQLLRVQVDLPRRGQMRPGGDRNRVVLGQPRPRVNGADRHDTAGGAVEPGFDGIEIEIGGRVGACTDIEVAIGGHHAVAGELDGIVRGERGTRHAGRHRGSAIGIGGDVLAQQALPTGCRGEGALAEQHRAAGGCDMGDVGRDRDSGIDPGAR